jgi:hypothetical protein
LAETPIFFLTILHKVSGLAMIRFIISRKYLADYILFTVFFVAVRFWANPSLLYEFPDFFLNMSVNTYAPWFITDASPYPGKIADQIVSFLIPYLSHAWMGAAVLTILAISLCLLFGWFLVGIGARTIVEFKFIPAAIMLLELGIAVNPLASAVSTVIGLTFVHLYRLCAGFASWQRCVLFIVFSGAIFIAAPQSFLLFVVLCMILEIKVKRNWLLASMEGFPAALLPPCCAVIFFPIFPSVQAYQYLLPPQPVWSAAVIWPRIFWIAPLVISIIAVCSGFLDRAASFVFRKSRWIGSINSNGVFRGLLVSILAVLLTVTATVTFRDTLSTIRPEVVMNHALLTRDWDLMLKAAARIPTRFLRPYHVHAIDRALYYKGRLLEDLFKVPQNQRSLFLYPFTQLTQPTNLTERSQKFIWGGWTWFELGLVNVAEHCALEAVAERYFPQGLKLLAKIYFIKDMPLAGRNCLRALEQDRGSEAWARAYLDSIGVGPAITLTPELRNISSVAMQSGFFLSGTPPLDSLVRQNPGNKMAYEYAIASCLIERDLDGIARYAGLLHEFQYPAIPLLLEEALLLRSALQGNQPELFGYRLSTETNASFMKFCTIFFTNHKGNRDEAFNDLAESCGYSYFFYYLFGFSKAIINEKK